MRRKSFWLLILVAVAAVAGYLAWPRPPSLLARARRLPGFMLFGSDTCTACVWDSDHVARICTTTGGWQRFDALTGQTADLGRRFPFGPSIFAMHGRFRSVYPDGHGWLLVDGSTHPQTLTEVSVNGNLLQAWPAYGGSEWLFWRPDGKGIVQYATQPPGIVVYSLDNPRPQRRRLNVPGRYLPFCCDNRNRLFAYATSPAARFPVKVSPPVFVLSPDAPGRARRLPVVLPAGVEITEAWISPQGDRILWWLAFPTQPYPLWLQNLLQAIGLGPRIPSRQDPPYTEEGLWVCRLDGSDMREIGRVKAIYAPDGLHTPGWMPDGRHVYFFYKRGLYIAPVD
jgi:hypothetical protein